MSTRCEWCGKKRYSGDDTTWIYDDYDVNGYRKRFFFCCRGHASRFDNETNYKKYDERLKCDYCGDKYYPGDGMWWHLRKAGKHRRYDYCSDSCGKSHKQSGNYVWVDSDGLTEDERAYYGRKKREAELERIKQQELEKIKKSEENSVFLQKYGVFLVLFLCCFAGAGMLKSATSDDIVPKMGMLAIFFGFYLFYSLFPTLFDGQEMKDLKKKHKFNLKPIPSIFRVVNITVSIVFLVLLLVLTLMVKANGNADFLFDSSSIKNENYEEVFENIKTEEVKKENTKIKPKSIEKSKEKSSIIEETKNNNQVEKKQLTPWEERGITKEVYELLLEDGYIEE
jgi:ribosomal protein L24E